MIFLLAALYLIGKSIYDQYWGDDALFSEIQMIGAWILLGVYRVIVAVGRK